MATFNQHPMSLENPYIFIDPFRPSITFSLNNIITSRRRVTTIDNVPLPPPNTVTRRYAPPPRGFALPRAPSSSYSYPSAKSFSEKSASPAASSSSRNTFGGFARRNDDTSDCSRAPGVPSPKPRHDSTSSFPLPRSDGESLPRHESTDQHSQLHHVTISDDVDSVRHRSSVSPIPSGSGSGQNRKTHRRNNRKSRDEAKSSIGCSNAISYYKPPTQSSQVALPPSSPYLPSHLPPTPHDPTPTTIPYTGPASDPPVHHPDDSLDLSTYFLAFVLDTLPRQIYLHLLLRLPHLYFTHVIHIFEDAEMSMPEIKQMALEANNHLKDPTTDMSKTLYLESGFTSPRYDHLSKSWRTFIDSLMGEWKIMNIISVLLLLAILTTLQIQGAANDPVTRFTALLSMMCALMSLLYGCIYIVCFGMMKSIFKAAEWAHEAQQTTTAIFWNAWVLLALPATWLAWSMIFFVISIMSFVWRTGTIDDANPKPITSRDALAPRIIITCFFSLGFLYLILIAVTFRRYGTTMDRAWRSRVLAWTRHKFNNNNNNNDNYINPSHGFQEYYPSNSKPVIQHLSTSIHHSSSQHLRNTSLPTRPIVPSSPSRAFTDKEKPRGRSTSIKPISTPVATKNSHRHPRASRKRLIKPTKLLGLSADDPSSGTIPSKDTLAACQMTKDDWERLSSEIHSAWDPHQLSTIQSILHHWNETFFNEHGTQIVLCDEIGVPWLKHAIYHFSCKDKLPTVNDRYDSIPSNLTRLDVLLSVSSGAAGIEKLSLFSSRLDVF